MYQEELATVKIVSSEFQVCFWSQLGLPTVLPPKSLLPLLFRPEVETYRAAMREIVLQVQEHYSLFKDLMLILKLMLLCLKRSFLLNHIFNIFYFIEYIKKEKKESLAEAPFQFYIFKGKWIHERIWSYNWHKMLVGNFARLINMCFTRGQIKRVVKLYSQCFLCFTLNTSEWKSKADLSKFLKLASRLEPWL